MSSSVDDGPGPEAPREPASTSTVRAVVLLVAFVVVLVLTLGLVHPSKPTSQAASTTTTSATATTVPPTTTTTVPPGKVPVVVANGSGVQGQAAAVSSQLSAAGWDVIPPMNASSSSVPTTGVFYVAGQSTEAVAVATTLHLPPTVVAPFTTSVPVASADGADVIVVIGSNGIPTSSTATTTTAATATTSS